VSAHALPASTGGWRPSPVPRTVSAVRFAQRLAGEGAAVVVNDIDGEGAREAVVAIASAGGRAVASAGDVRNPIHTDAMVAAAEREFGGLDILVNNAGLVRPAPAHEMTDEQWDLVVDVVLRGAFNAVRSAARLLRRSEGEEIGYHRKVIGISSVAGVHGGTGGLNYSAAKAGLIGLSKALAREWASQQINVNVVAPGRIGGTLIGEPRDEQTGRPLRTTPSQEPQPTIPIGRVGNPDDVAALVAFLSSPESDYLTGQVIELHGGRELLR